MNRRLVLPEEDYVTHHARVLLSHAEVGQKLPTPVDDLVECAGLVVSHDAALDEDYAEYFGARERYRDALGASSRATLESALRKTLGLFDPTDNVVYLDRAVSPQKQKFLKLHEAGHKMLPWQLGTYMFLDNEATLAPDVKKLY